MRTDVASVIGHPFSVVTTRDGRWAFVSLDSTVGVFSAGSFLPQPVRTIAVPGQAAGQALTPDGKHLIVTDFAAGGSIIDIAAATSGSPSADPVAATLAAPSGTGSVEVAVTPDGRYALVTLENSKALAVFDVGVALRADQGRSAYLGQVPVGDGPVGVAISPEGRWAYVTSEGRRGSAGTVSVIDLSRATTDPAKAVVATVAADCSPVRVITSPDGSIVWVTARGSDEVLAFSATRLRSDPAHARLAQVPVGPAPVGLALAHGGRYLVVGDSNRFGAANAPADVRILDVAAALAGRPATVATVPADGFPRDLAITPDGRTALVPNYSTEHLQAIDLTALP